MDAATCTDFLQYQPMVKGHKFIAQLDIDQLDTRKEWPDAGLAGCVYVCVSDDETTARAFWQYT